MLILAIILLIFALVLLVLSFLMKTKTKTVICGVTYLVTFWLSIIFLCISVNSMTLEQARFINHNVFFCMQLGIVVLLIGYIIHGWIKSKQKSEEKKLAAWMVELLGLFISIASIFMSMTTYIRISRLTTPIVTYKNIDTIYVGQEYTIDDFIAVDNSYRKYFGDVAWSGENYGDTNGIVISEDGERFKVLAGEGEIFIQIKVDGSNRSDIKTDTLYVIVKSPD